MNIVVYLEHRDGAVVAPSLETLTLARTLAGDGTVTAVLCGDNVDGFTATAGEHGADAVKIATDARLAQVAPAAHARAIATAAAGADLVLMACTSLGRDLGGRVAARLETTCVADCSAIESRDGGLVFTRPMYAGKVVAETTVEGPAVASLRPKAVAAAANAKAGAAEALSVDFADSDFAAVVTARETAAGDRVSLGDADIVVAGGRGVKGSADPSDEAAVAANFKLIEDLADALGAAIGMSRAVVDAGWRPHSEQVGQTGKTVTPTLYIAVGISGAIQHLVGMRNSGRIIAINNNADAPIFEHADLGIVGDLFEVVPALTDAIKAAKS